MTGLKVGLIGFGHIGQAVARRLEGFGSEVLYYDPRDDLDLHGLLAVEMGLDELLSVSDIVSLHTPLLSETKNLLNEHRLALMKQGAIVINTARGGLIDEAALNIAIKSGLLWGAGLDVTSEEPLSQNSPLLVNERVILTPHIGGAVANNFSNVVRKARANIDCFLRGEPVIAEDMVN